MGKIISFANQKGGVGKTTSAVNVAASLGILGYKTLLVDLDPQGSATSGVGVVKKGLKNSTTDLLTTDIDPERCIVSTEYKGLDIVPCTVSLAAAEFKLYELEESEFRLKKALTKTSCFRRYAIALFIVLMNAVSGGSAIRNTIDAKERNT